MNNICTSIEQSKKLIELGIDVNTADMLWTYDFTVNDINGLNVISKHLKPEENDIPCWSLAALLGVIPKPDLVQNSEGTWLLHSWVNDYPWSVGGYSNPVDACVEMIIKLRGLNLL